MPTAPGTPPPARLHGLPSRMFTQLAVRVHRMVAEELGEYHTHHYALLAALAERGAASQAELGRACGIDRSDVVAALTELTTQDLVRREPDPSHGRRNLIRLTPTGQRVLADLDERIAAVQERFLAPLPADDRTRFTETLATLLEHHTGS
ncbi:DNA-binding MarR family transcriptional regulator [Lipingzhangella halophila]|uniref:DNA-binding MarR family transcriptional regulator n=1 Tax=Lipingzhangella halophila TaxID=1783352 RepID=A0A7W7RLR2_9ACTN|nr:MarR family transcriptional regulator [Lipingzhangella halophila]MBB4934299.1 DNA-binding MarR family transcriptional regulator [Lipingzhangella halophila]